MINFVPSCQTMTFSKTASKACFFRVVAFLESGHLDTRLMAISISCWVAELRRRRCHFLECLVDEEDQLCCKTLVVAWVVPWTMIVSVENKFGQSRGNQKRRKRSARGEARLLCIPLNPVDSQVYRCLLLEIIG